MQMKFKAHQSFAVRKGWLGKGLRTIANPDNAALLMPSNSKAAMDELGLGSNQVVALRYWMQTLGLVDYRKGSRNRERDLPQDRKSTRLNSSHSDRSRMPSSA